MDYEVLMAIEGDKQIRNIILRVKFNHVGRKQRLRMLNVVSDYNLSPMAGKKAH